MMLTMIIIQLFCIVCSTYLLFQERKYCKHKDWWSDIGMVIFIMFYLIPIAGIFVAVGGMLDYHRNITDELKKA